MTRKESSRLLVAVTGGLVFGLAAVFAAVGEGPRETRAAAPPASDTVPPRETPLDSARVARGRVLFREVGCTGCHSAEGEGSRRIPLDGVGGRLSPDTLRAWIVEPESVQPGVRKPAYDDLPPDEVGALVAYMRSLRDEG